jgi:hypothetical protein
MCCAALRYVVLCRRRAPAAGPLPCLCALLCCGVLCFTHSPALQTAVLCCAVLQMGVSRRGPLWTLLARTWPLPLPMPLSTPGLARTSWSRCHLRLQGRTRVRAETEAATSYNSIINRAGCASYALLPACMYADLHACLTLQAPSITSASIVLCCFVCFCLLQCTGSSRTRTTARPVPQPA